MMRRLFVALFVAVFGVGCVSSTSSLIDRSELMVSDSSRISAQNLIPYASHYPQAVEQLGMAQEVYHRKLFLLKERRNTLRSRKRVLNTLSYGTMAATTLGVGASAITTEGQSQDGLQNAGYAALAGLAAGTIFQTLSFMQEDTGSIDAKIRHLDLLYDTMVERLRQLSTEGEFAKEEGRGRQQLQSEMGAAIESFISAAMAINVKG